MGKQCRWRVQWVAALLLVGAGPWGRAAHAQNQNTAELTARSFFAALVRGQVETMSALTADRANFDGLVVDGRQRVDQQLSVLAKRARAKLLVVRAVHVLTYRDAVRRFGPPPARLKRTVRSSDLIALALLKHGGIVAILGRAGGQWQIKGLTD